MALPQRWHIVWVLFAMSVVLYVDRINITIAAPSLASDFQLSPGELGSVLSAFLFGYAIGLVPGGYLADRLGPHRLLTGAGLSWAVVTLLAGALPGRDALRHGAAVELLVAARFVLGLCEACAFPTFNRAVANWMLPDERARANGWITCGAGVGGAVTPLLVASIIARSGWRMAFVVSGLLTLGVSCWWWRTGADSPEGKLAGTRIVAPLPGREWFRKALRSREAWLLCTSEFFYGIAQFVYMTWFYTYYVTVRGAAVLTAAGLSSLPYLAIAVGAPLGGILCDLSVRRFSAPWGRRLVPLIVLTLSGLCAVTAPTIANDTLSAAVFAAAAGLQYMAAAAYWSTVIDITRRGTGILGGFMNGSTYLGSAVATKQFPVAAEMLGAGSAIRLAGVAALLSAAIWFWIRSSREIDTQCE